MGGTQSEDDLTACTGKAAPARVSLWTAINGFGLEPLCAGLPISHVPSKPGSHGPSISDSVSDKNESAMAAFHMFAALPLMETSVLPGSPETKAARLENEIEQIYRQTHGTICSYIRCLGVLQSQAQEVAQEVYLRLYQTMRKGEEILNVRAWLFRVAHNLSLNVQSREKRFRPLDPDWERVTADAGESPERAMLDREKARKVRSALETLSPQQRHCLYLRAEGLRYREIAAVMSISPNTVNEFLKRAISRLAEAVNA
jgi:RNA polymerase sigma-70 factor (ECF subfamily)